MCVLGTQPRPCARAVSTLSAESSLQPFPTQVEFLVQISNWLLYSICLSIWILFELTGHFKTQNFNSLPGIWPFCCLWVWFLRSCRFGEVVFRLLLCCMCLSCDTHICWNGSSFGDLLSDQSSLEGSVLIPGRRKWTATLPNNSNIEIQLESVKPADTPVAIEKNIATILWTRVKISYSKNDNKWSRIGSEREKRKVR